MINKIICKIKKHSFVLAGSCPYTGKTYSVCLRCKKLADKNDI